MTLAATFQYIITHFPGVVQTLKYKVEGLRKLYVLKHPCGRFGALKSDSTHHFFRNACTKSGSLRFSQFSGC
jgi:hypothetical protein